MKRKRAGDGYDSLRKFNPQSKTAKRQKYGTCSDEITARGSGEESSGLSRVYPLVRKPIHECATETDNSSPSRATSPVQTPTVLQ